MTSRHVLLYTTGINNKIRAELLVNKASFKLYYCGEQWTYNSLHYREDFACNDYTVQWGQTEDAGGSHDRIKKKSS